MPIFSSQSRIDIALDYNLFLISVALSLASVFGYANVATNKHAIIFPPIDCVSEYPLKIQKSDLYPHWFVLGMMLLSLLVYLFVCYQFGHELQESIPETDRIVIRTIFYAIAIAALPITNLIRHVQLRLNQTMPGNKLAKSRYLLTVIVSMMLVEGIGVLGFVMFMLGDDLNTLYIFLGLSALGLFLYRPKEDEYFKIVEALADKVK